MSNGQVKLSNTKFTSIKNDFALVFEKEANIVEVPDDATIDEQVFSFTTIKDIGQLDQIKTLDVVGVVKEVGALTEIVIKNGGQQRQKKTITILDDSYPEGATISVCFWGQNAKREDLKEG